MAYSSIVKPGDYFNTKLYSGTGSSQAVTGVGFQPDWIWFKCRTQAQNHNLFDVIRGSNKIIQSSTVNAEATSTALLTSFDSDGFTVNTDGGVNGSGQTYASWNWLANGAGSANTDGSISSTVSSNTTSGFSIVTYDGTGSAGATVGHGLGVAPSMIIAKKIDGAVSNWAVYHKSLGANKYLQLNTTNASVTSATRWNNVEPTSSVFTVGSSGDTNNNGETIVAYCFAEKQGYSKFGSYTGNGSTDGTFIYTGFKPAFVLTKSTSNAVNWQMQDNKTAPHNLMVNKLFANTSATQDTGSENTVDFLSNGFKPRGTGSSENINGNGYSYIYMAFAEEPLVANVGTGVPATAR